MNFSKLLLIAGISIALGALRLSEGAYAFRQWVAEMHIRQVELLKIEWGNPGFCSEWERDYNPKTLSCGTGARQRPQFRRGRAK